MLQLVEIELGDVLERLVAGEEGYAGALLGGALAVVRRGADHLQRRYGIAVRELHPVFIAVAPDRQLQPFRQRVDH